VTFRAAKDLQIVVWNGPFRLQTSPLANGVFVCDTDANR
jgi:hypothetical protein